MAVWQGKSPTASQVVFHDGKADKDRYRYYHLEERPEGNNDFAMMREVFTRRLKYNDELTDIVGDQALFDLPTTISDPAILEQLTLLGKDKEVKIHLPEIGTIKINAIGIQNSFLIT